MSSENPDYNFQAQKLQEIGLQQVLCKYFHSHIGSLRTMFRLTSNICFHFTTHLQHRPQMMISEKSEFDINLSMKLLIFNVPLDTLT